MTDSPEQSGHWVPPYIVDQQWSLLKETDDPQKFLQPEHMRGEKFSQHTELNEESWFAMWRELNVSQRTCVAMNSLVTHDQQQPVDLQYVVLTTDAGIGKSKSTEWLNYWLSCSDSQFVSFRFELSTLIEKNDFSKADFSDRLLDHLAGIWRNKASEKITLDDSRGFVRHSRDTGRLCLILDGLDQLSGDSSLVSWIMETPKWQQVRLFIAGRPNSVIAHWDKIFEDKPWRFVHVDAFYETQQDRFLGPKLRQIPQHVLPQLRPIMKTPRVLEYLLKLQDYSQVRTAADIYFLAIENIIRKGILNSNEARKSIHPRSDDAGEIDTAQVTNAFTLLSAIAFETLIFHHDDPTFSSGSPSRPEDRLTDRFSYSEHVDSGGDFNQLKVALRQRWSSLSLRGDVEDYLPGLAALGDILENGTLAANEKGLKQVKFSNRSLHEFLVAYFLSTYAQPADIVRLWDWIYIKDNAETDAYYFAWQFLCEMPDGKRLDNGPRIPQTWLNSIAMLFQPCQCDKSITDSDDPAWGEPTRYFAKRSTEMMFRCWESLQEYRKENAKPKIQRVANRIFDDWIGEFEQIMGETKGPTQGDPRQAAAVEFKKHLMPIEGGSFRMGTLPKKQGVALLNEDFKQSLRGLFDGWQADNSALKRWLSESSTWPGRQGKETKSRFNKDWMEFVQNDDFEGWLDFRWPADQTPLSDRKRKIAEFELGRTTVCNRWFRLFDPGHYQRSAGLWTSNDVSPTPAHPAIYLSWFDAFIVTQWFHWDNESCRLPWQDEWEYVAKLGLSSSEQDDEWHHRYWWGDEFNSEDHPRIQCRETRDTCCTALPSEIQSSDETRRRDPVKPPGKMLGFGISCQLGNVWEWCQDVYRKKYDIHSGDCPGQPSLSRVVRGGSFNSVAEYCTSSNRNDVNPAFADDCDGLRVARVRRKIFDP